MSDHPSTFELIQWADRVVAEDAARQRLATVPQEPWPTDGSLPVAAHVVLYVDPETGEREVAWTGHAYGVTASCHTKGLAGPLYVHPTLEMDGANPVLHVRLVDDQGCTMAYTMDWAGWWSA